MQTSLVLSSISMISRILIFLEETIGHIPETISCRYNPGGVFTLSNGIMDNPGDSKYGMTKEQLFEAFKILKSKGAKYFGVHAFLASNTVTNEYYPQLAKGAFLSWLLSLKMRPAAILDL